MWLATLFSLLLLVQRSFAVETADGALDALRVAGIEPAGIFLGKSMALAAQLALLELLLLLTAVVLYGTTVEVGGIVLLVTTWLAATTGLAFVGTLYGGLAARCAGQGDPAPPAPPPVVAPVLIGATRATEAALGTAGTAVSEGWPWLALLTVFAAAFGTAGTVAFGPLIEE